MSDREMMPPADPTPPLRAARLAALRADAEHTLARAVPQPEACRWASISLELLDAHAALTAQLAACRAELFEASQAGELLDAARRELAARTAERDALMSGVADWLDNYTQWAQLIDGWRQDGSDWSEWDEATRLQMAKVALRLSALLAAPTEG